MPEREIVQTPGGELRFEFRWSERAAAHAVESTQGELCVWLGDDLIWGVDSLGNGTSTGIFALWIEMLEYLGNYWLYLTLEQGYPFAVSPESPSRMDQALELRWEKISDLRQAAEEEVSFAFKLTHNLAEASPGALRPDIWFVRDGGVFVVEAQLGPRSIVKRLPSAEVKQALLAIGELIADRLKGASDARAMQSLQQWVNRESNSPEILTQIATGRSLDYLQQTCGADSFDDVFGDPESSWFDDNMYVDLAYRCKGVLPPKSLRSLIDRARTAGGRISPALEAISHDALAELTDWNVTLPRPYQQGYALANWMRQKFADDHGRINPDDVLSKWDVILEKRDFATPALDAVAFWAHGRQPTVIWNESDKHSANTGALRATLAHEICHLLVDRNGELPLLAVARGAMNRFLEKRANAFAAEFLCPRQEAAREYQQNGASGVELAISRLTERFGVSQHLAALQLAPALFNETAQQEIEAIAPGATFPWS